MRTNRIYLQIMLCRERTRLIWIGAFEVKWLIVIADGSGAVVSKMLAVI